MKTKAPHEHDEDDHHHSLPLAATTVAALGVVFGDIGTSPLYALQTSLHALGDSATDPIGVRGIVSLILWALTLVVSLKYVAIVMRADNDGEGGILALVALVTRKEQAGRLSFLVVVGVIGSALLYGDGVITPAISVLSAIEGLKVPAPQLEPYVIPITLVILVLLFSIQSRGTGGLGKLFGPIMIAWFVGIALLGLRGIQESPQILEAIDPRAAIGFLRREPGQAFIVFGLIFLSLTGAEALYADMGHFGPRPIRLSWFALVYPALILNYLGQGGWVLAHPEAADNPFFQMTPAVFQIPMVVLAAAATVIASQALISGVFSLTRQAMALRLMPRMEVRATSAKSSGQIYVPFMNWILMAMTLVVVVGFKSSDSLAGAYGVAVSATMLATTLLLYRVMIAEWQWPAASAFTLIGVFAAIDAAFFAANASKFLEGGWLPIALGALVALCMICWRIGNNAVARRLSGDGSTMEEFLSLIDSCGLKRVPGTAVFLTRGNDRASPMLLHYVRHSGSLHERVVLFSVDLTKQPRVAPDKRLTVEEIGKGIFAVTARIGFMQRIDIVGALKGCVKLGYAFCDNVHYFVAHEGLVRRPRQPRLPGLVWIVYNFLQRIGLRAADYFHLPEWTVMEVGFRLEI